MPTLPQLIEEDILELERALDQLLRSTEAGTALIIDKGGFLITQCGDTRSVDTTTLAALAAGSFAATQTIASIVNEPNFSSLYQQGEQFSLLVSNVDEYCLLAVVFRAGAPERRCGEVLRRGDHQGRRHPAPGRHQAQPGPSYGSVHAEHRRHRAALPEEERLTCDIPVGKNPGPARRIPEVGLRSTSAPPRSCRPSA